MPDEAIKEQIKALSKRVDNVEKQQENMNLKLTEINDNVIKILALQQTRVEIEDLKNGSIYTELKQDITINKQDIKEMQDNNKWLWRTIGGTIIATFIGFIIEFIKKA